MNDENTIERLHYDPKQLPTPVTVQDMYFYAMLCEMRDTRITLIDLTLATNEIALATQNLVRMQQLTVKRNK